MDKYAESEFLFACAHMSDLVDAPGLKIDWNFMKPKTFRVTSSLQRLWTNVDSDDTFSE